MNADVVRKILWSAIEDYTGLWELVWGLFDVLPSAAIPERRQIAEDVVRELLARQWIQLYREPTLGSAMMPVPASEMEAELSNDANWTPPRRDSVAVRIGATDRGEAAYKTREV